jgi:hypothetical protein
LLFEIQVHQGTIDRQSQGIDEGQVRRVEPDAVEVRLVLGDHTAGTPHRLHAPSGEYETARHDLIRTEQ